MEFFRIRKDIPFMNYAFAFNILSIIIISFSIYSLTTKGLNFSIEFTGGIDVQMSFTTPPEIESIRHKVEEVGYQDVPVQRFGAATEILIRLPTPKTGDAGSEVNKVVDAIKQIDSSVETRRIDFVGPQVGKELAIDGITALIIVAIGIIIYLAIRFEWRLAVASVIANMHDVLVILGLFAFFQWEFSLPVLAGTLAVLGYSVNESVIIFDRVRESFRNMRTAKISAIMDHSLTINISRTVITHGSTQIMVLTMLIFGGPALHNFAIALTIGILFGIYSSMFISCPLAMYFGVDRKQFIKKPKDKGQNPDGAII